MDSMSMTISTPPQAASEEDERQIRALLVDYCELVDSGDIDKWADCYTDDAVFEGLKGELRGREALLRYGRETVHRGFFLHFLTNVRVRLEGPLSASASSYLLYTQTADDGRSVVVPCRQRDRLVKVAGRWRLSERRIEGRPVLGAFL